MTTTTDTATTEPEEPGAPADPDADPPEPESEPGNAQRAQASGAGDPAGPGAVRCDVSVAAGVEDHRAADPETLSWLRIQTVAAVATLGRAVARVSIRLVDDATMTTLHDRHLGINETTDVLTFAAASPPEPIEADIAICVDEAARQSARRGHPVRHELLLYTVHGLLHCAGFDDQEPAAYDAMHEEEDRILRAIGVGSTFGAEGHRDQHDGRGTDT